VSAEIACTEAAGLSGQETADVPGVDLAHADVAREDLHRPTGIGNGRSVARHCQHGHGLFYHPCRAHPPHAQVRAAGRRGSGPVRPLDLESGPGPGRSGYTHRSRSPAVAGHRCKGGVAGVIGELEERTG
jgi:hypothetical protein